jgi:hypothetical protein
LSPLVSIRIPESAVIAVKSGFSKSCVPDVYAGVGVGVVRTNK